MHIIQANKAYLPHLGGVETIVQQLAEGIAAMPGYRSTVIACSDNNSKRERCINGVRTIYAPTLTRIASLPISPAYAAALLNEDADILHIHEPSLLPAAAYIMNREAAKRKFRKLVIWWHSDIVRQRVARPLYEPLLDAILSAADAIIVATPKHISSSRYLPKFSEKCHVVHFGIDPKRFADTPEQDQAVAALKAKFGKPIVLFTGRLVYYKSVSYLIDAMRPIPDAQLVIVGKGPLQAELEAQAARQGNVAFLPPVSEAELIALYKACSIFALPSAENSEQFGIVQLEAMACGKPVITADLETGVTYMNLNGETGLVVEKRSSAALTEAISTLLDNNDLRIRMGNFAKQRALSDFSLDGMLASTVKLYQTLLD